MAFKSKKMASKKGYSKSFSSSKDKNSYKKVRLTVSALNQCEFQGNVTDVKYSKSQNGPMFSGRLLLDRNKFVFVRAFEDEARELYKAKVKDGDPLHVIAEYSPFRTQEGNYLYQFVIREILDVENKKKAKKNVDDFDDEGYEEDSDEEIEDDEEEFEDEEEEDDDLWS